MPGTPSNPGSPIPSLWTCALSLRVSCDRFHPMWDRPCITKQTYCFSLIAFSSTWFNFSRNSRFADALFFKVLLWKYQRLKLPMSTDFKKKKENFPKVINKRKKSSIWSLCTNKELRKTIYIYFYTIKKNCTICIKKALGTKSIERNPFSAQNQTLRSHRVYISSTKQASALIQKDGARLAAWSETPSYINLLGAICIYFSSVQWPISPNKHFWQMAKIKQKSVWWFLTISCLNFLPSAALDLTVKKIYYAGLIES